VTYPLSQARVAIEALFGAPVTPARSRLLGAHYPQLASLDETDWQTFIREAATVQRMATDGWDLDAIARLSVVINRLGIGDDIRRLVSDVIAFATTEEHR
jgi:hypothetical protein